MNDVLIPHKRSFELWTDQVCQLTKVQVYYKDESALFLTE